MVKNTKTDIALARKTILEKMLANMEDYSFEHCYWEMYKEYTLVCQELGIEPKEFKVSVKV